MPAVPGQAAQGSGKQEFRPFRRILTLHHGSDADRTGCLPAAVARHGQLGGGHRSTAVGVFNPGRRTGRIVVRGAAPGTGRKSAVRFNNQPAMEHVHSAGPRVLPGLFNKEINGRGVKGRERHAFAQVRKNDPACAVAVVLPVEAEPDRLARADADKVGGIAAPDFDLHLLHASAQLCGRRPAGSEKIPRQKTNERRPAKNHYQVDKVHSAVRPLSWFCPILKYAFCSYQPERLPVPHQD